MIAERIELPGLPADTVHVEVGEDKGMVWFNRAHLALRGLAGRERIVFLTLRDLAGRELMVFQRTLSTGERSVLCIAQKAFALAGLNGERRAWVIGFDSNPLECTDGRAALTFTPIGPSEMPDVRAALEGHGSAGHILVPEHAFHWVPSTSSWVSPLWVPASYRQ